MKFGFCVPVFANPGAAFFRTPALTELDPIAAVDAAVEAERLGYDSVWVADHLMHGFDDATAGLARRGSPRRLAGRHRSSRRRLEQHAGLGSALAREAGRVAGSMCEYG